MAPLPALPDIGDMRLQSFPNFLAQRLRWCARGSSDERGGALVEFGVVIPIFVTLILGSVTMGMSYNMNNSLNNGARESARYGATLPIDGDIATWLDRVADAAEASTSGNLGAAVESRQICIAFVHPAGTDNNDRTTVLLRDAGGTVMAAGAPCFEDGRPDDERRVQVQLNRDTEIQAVVVDSTVRLEAASVVRYERSGT